MALIQNLKAAPQLPNTIGLSWTMPIDFNNSNSEIIITRTTTHYPMELYNVDFSTKATDVRPVELFRGKTIVGTNIGTISVLGNTITDTSAAFPVASSLKGRLVRDSLGQVFKIQSNTTTSITLEAAPTNGKYVVLPDFPTTKFVQENYEVDSRTTAGVGFIKNLVQLINGSLLIRLFEQDELANCIFSDGSGNKFIIKSNTSDTVYFFEANTPTISTGLAILDSFKNSATSVYVDTFKNKEEADARVGTGLLNNSFYYYTGFTLKSGANVAQAEFGQIRSNISTQSEAISMKDIKFGDLLYNKLWPSLYRELDESGDLEDLMQVFGFQFGELHALIDTYNLQDSQNVFVNAVLPLSEQFGLPSVGFTIGVDTLRRIAERMIPCWKLKGTKEGIALYIKMLTTWDITNGTADFNEAVVDFLPNVAALRFFDSTLGNTNTRLTQSAPSFISGGRFAKSLPGIVIPGFFSFREFVITLSNVALYVGSSTAVSVANNNTTISNTNANFGAIDSLVGNFLLPNQEEVNDIYQIVSNTSTSITVKGIINNKNIGGSYAVLSPLNTNRFIILNKLMPQYIPFNTKVGWIFV